MQYAKLLYRINKHLVAMKNLQNKRAENHNCEHKPNTHTQYAKLLYRINKHLVTMKTLQNKRALISITFVLPPTV